MNVYIPTPEGAYCIRAWYCLFDGFEEFSWFPTLGFFEANTYSCSLERCNCFYHAGCLHGDCRPRSALCWGSVWVWRCSFSCLSNFVDSGFDPVELSFGAVALCGVCSVPPLKRLDTSGRFLHSGADLVSRAYFLLFREIVFDFVK